MVSVRLAVLGLGTTLLLVAAGCGSGEAGTAQQPQGGNQPNAVAAPQHLHLVLEAEDMPGLAAPMVVREEAGTSGGKVVRVPAGVGNEGVPTGQFTVPLDLPAAQEVTVWMRVHWSGSCANSLTLKAPGIPPLIVGEGGTYNTWHWVKAPAALPLAKGPVELLIQQREEDVGIDQILITSDPQYIPMGIE